MRDPCMRGARAVLGGLIIAACYVDYAYTDGRTQPYCVLECVYMRTHSCYRCVQSGDLHTLIGSIDLGPDLSYRTTAVSY